MWARRNVFRKFSSVNNALFRQSQISNSNPLIKNGSRSLHVFRPRPSLHQPQAYAFTSNKLHRVAGYLVLCRNESTIPPLASEVFSKQAENSQSTITATAAVSEPSATATNLPTSATTTSHAAASEAVTNSTAATSEQLVWESIPEAPGIPVEELTQLALSSNGEPTFASIGLGGWSPSGIVQQLLEYAHVGLGIPWWTSIVIGTICVRLLVFPLVVKSQRNAARMANNMPELQTIQLKMTEARQTGNALMAAKYGQDMMTFMKEKEISPFKNMIVPLAMAPIFISFFFGLRKMANLPVESMKEGGLFWFTDLTVADPYFILPLVTSITMWITMEVGVDGVKLQASQHGQIMKYFIRAVPFIMFPLTMNFPAAILCYWVSTNAVSLCQVSLLRLPAVRTKLNIEQMRKFSPEVLPIKKKKFVESVKDSWTNVKITKEMEDRVRYDEMTFKRAGRGPIPKTYKYDPTKVPPANAIQAKKQ